jgi:Tol biopolymer transport system component/C-terminal processing protease CtpA/Prc
MLWLAPLVAPLLSLSRTDARHVSSAPKPAGVRVAQAASKPALSDPAPSPDGSEIVFVAGGDLWTVAAAGGAARLLVAHPATEARPLWSPDGTRIAFTSTRTGNGDIYVLDLATGRVIRRTFDDGREQLDSWSRDGKWLYYSSSGGDISGMNDVWRLPADGGQPAVVAGDRYASEYWAAPSPDGRTVAITARGTVSGQWWRHGHSHIDESEIWLVSGLDAATPTYTAFGASGGAKDAWPMWSADGRTLYYVSDRGGEENLWAQRVNGGATPGDSVRSLTRFTNGRVLWPQIAHDGSVIVFERNYGIWRHDLARNTVAEVPITLRGATAEPVPERQTVSQGFTTLAVAPDARKAAFIARGDLFVVGTRDGGDATRLTATPAVDAEPTWLPDSRRLVYASMRGTDWHLYMVDAVSRVERPLTSGVGRNYGARVSPDGRWIAYQRNGDEIRVMAADGTNDRRVAQADVSEPPFGGAGTLSWSPDSRLIGYTARGRGGWGNVWVVGLDGAAPRQVTFGADANVSGVQWSPDGTFLLYRSAQRTEIPRVIRVDLVPRTPRFREDQYLDLFGPPPATPPASPLVPRDSATRAAMGDSLRTITRSASNARVTVNIAFDGIRTRTSVLPTERIEIGQLAISPNGRTLVFSGTAGGQQQIYAYALDELSREAQVRALTTSPGGKSALQWSPDSREVWYLEGGRISALVVESRQARTIAAAAETDVSFEMEKRAVFDQMRSYLAHNFFDSTMHGVDWASLGDRVAPYVEGSRNPDDLRRVLSLMIGELNASHLGISGPTTGGTVVPMARLGVRFNRAALESSGRYQIGEVVDRGPGAIGGLAIGDVITAVDGVALARGIVLDSLLVGRVGRRVSLTVTAASGAVRPVSLLPVALGAEKGLLYRQWVEQRRAYVARISNGRLGYVHMFDMGEGSLDQLYLDLDAENQARDGVVVDVRNNNGGFVNPYAIDVLARRSYLLFTPRGSQASPARGSLGQRTLERPTVLVTNQHTLSDGEDFTEGYRSLGLGKVVGEPTSGWIIFTSNVPLLDGSTLRIPTTRVTDAQGRDMELRPRAVDILVIRPIGESYSGRDKQLDGAVSALLEALPRRP